ncbi:MAG: TonB-dependent receptor [Caulobacter sp. 32-67-35]|nr:MAG: TonB-dependent receptor [Caulobacter sp. 32-67-35]
MNKSNLRGAASIGALVMALASAGAGAAQEIRDTTIGEIVVTANRREQSVLEVPYNISAVSGDAIEDGKMLDAAELMRGIPGVSVVDRGYRNGGVVNNVLIRGINVDSNALGDYAVSSVAPVSTYQNDTPLFAGFLLKDLDRVEVLRGPQGTLYGSGSLGGTVRYITRAPRLGQFGGAANITASQVEGSGSTGWAGDLTVNLPLGDMFALRATVSQIDYPGLTDYVNLYVLDSTGAPAAPSGVLSPNAAYTGKKDADTVEISFARVALLFEPSDRFNATLTYSQQSDEVGGRRQVTRGLDGYGKRYGDYQNGSIQLEPSSRDVSLGALEMNIDLGFATLTSSTSVYNHEGDSVSENTGFYAKAGFLSFYYNYPRPMASAVRAYSDEATIEEIRLVSKAGGDFDYVVGLYLNDNTLVSTQQSYLRGFKRWWDTSSGFPSAVAGDQDFAYSRREDFNEKAVYGELTWRPTDNLALTGGVRWFDNKAVNTTAIDVPLYASLSQPATARFESSESKALLKGNLSWTFAEKGLFYATVSQGYRRGGSNAVPLTGNFAEDARWQTYRSDSVVNYEAGLKGRLGVFTYDAAAFYVDWDDIQLNTATPNWGFYVVQNGGKARTYGLETSIDARPTDAFHYALGYTYTKAELTEAVISPLGTVLGVDGSMLPGTPEHAITLAADYTWSLPGDVTLVARGGGYYQSATRNAIGSPTFNTGLSDFTLWNGSATLAKGPWAATLFVKNILNEDGVTGEFTEAYMGTRPAVGYYGNASKQFISLPRTLGLSLDYSF